MKGIIADCLSGMVTSKAGRETWETILQKSGLAKDSRFATTADIDDAVILKIVQTACEVLGITLQQAADMFGSYWVMSYTQQYYSPLFKLSKNAKEFFQKLDQIHTLGVRGLKDARPPRFHVTLKDDNTMLIDYSSHRGLIDFAIGLARGIGEFYRETIEVSKVSDTQFRVVFSESVRNPGVTLPEPG